MSYINFYDVCTQRLLLNTLAIKILCQYVTGFAKMSQELKCNLYESHTPALSRPMTGLQMARSAFTGRILLTL